MNTLCLVVDRLHIGYLGTYGNAWIETPAVDRLGAEGCVFDQCLIDSPQLERLYRSYWLGRHALEPLELSDDRSLARLLAEAGVGTTLVTDAAEVARHGLAGDFGEVLELAPADAEQSADRIDQTHLGRAFARLIGRIEALAEPYLLWCHLTGLAGPWDAPREYRLRYVEPGDPEAPAWIDPPNKLLEEDFDPDDVLGISQAYAGQVSLLDACVGALLEALEELPSARRTLLVLVAARGFPLGEHRRVGPCDEALYAELVHVPLLVRLPSSETATVRSQALVHPADLCATILDWHGIAPHQRPWLAGSLVPLMREESESIRDRLCIVGGDRERAIRTPAWYLREATTPELFRKPDDRWEVNEVSDRCAEVVELLRESLGQYQEVVLSSRSTQLPPIPEILASGIE
jgi:arylsulfatase A-like enzyme